jgi:hypothetical protein
VKVRKAMTATAVALLIANEIRGLIVVAGLIASGAAGDMLRAAAGAFQ